MIYNIFWSYIQLINRTVLFLIIQFSISHLFNLQIGRYQVFPLQARVDLLSNGNEEVLLIPQSTSITGASPSNCLVSYPGDSLEAVLPLCRDAVCILQPQPSDCKNENNFAVHQYLRDSDSLMFKKA